MVLAQDLSWGSQQGIGGGCVIWRLEWGWKSHFQDGAPRGYGPRFFTTRASLSAVTWHLASPSRGSERDHTAFYDLSSDSHTVSSFQGNHYVVGILIWSPVHGLQVTFPWSHKSLSRSPPDTISPCLLCFPLTLGEVRKPTQPILQASWEAHRNYQGSLRASCSSGFPTGSTDHRWTSGPIGILTNFTHNSMFMCICIDLSKETLIWILKRSIWTTST